MTLRLSRLRWLLCVPLAAAVLAALASFAPSPAGAAPAAPVRWCAFDISIWHVKYVASIYVHTGCGGEFQAIASTNNGVYHGNTTGSHGRSDAYTYPYAVHSFGYRWRFPPGLWHNVWPAWASTIRAHLTAAHGPRAPPALLRLTQPSVSYLVVSRETRITINRNPSNTGVQAWEQCYNSARQLTGTHYGGWKYSVGAVSVAGTCDIQNHVGRAGYRYRKSDPILVICYHNGESTSGYC